LKIFAYLLVIISALVIVEYARNAVLEDLSMQKPNISSANHAPTYLISYADGKESIYRNQNAVSHYGLNKNIDFIFNYRKNHIEAEFAKKHQDILQEKIGAGMWLWKPYFLLKTLNKVEENAVVIYLDAAFIINKPLDEFINSQLTADVLLVQDQMRLNGAYVKGDSFALTGCDFCRNLPHIWSALIIVRNTKESRHFIAQWLNYAQDRRILDNKNNQIQENFPEYLWHHYDQSVLSLVYAKNLSKATLISQKEIAPYFSWFHRKNSQSSPNKIFYSLYGANPWLNFNKSLKSLPSTALLNLPPVVFLRKLWYLR
jgi:hypothetical protein